MDFNMEKQGINRSEIVYEGSVEQPVDCDVTLPDYCPDIMRILRCTITPGIASAGASGDRVTSEGTAVVRIIYVSDSGKISCYEQTVPFSKSVNVSGLSENVCVRAVASTQYCNCRAVNQRRADIHGCIAISFMVTAVKKQEILCGVKGGGVQLKKKNMKVSDTICRLEKMFVLNEVKELDEDSPAVMRILNTRACARVSEVKAITNKILLKGEVWAKITYCTEDGGVCCVEHTMPISQIIEAEGIDENSNNCVHLDVCSFEVVPKADSASEMKLMDITARVSAFVTASCEKELETVCDAYSTEYEADCEKQMMSLETLAGSFSDICLCRGTIEAPEAVSEIIDVWCTGVTEKAFIVSGKVKISGSLSVCVLYQSADSQPCMAEKTLDYEYERDVSMSGANGRCEPWVYPGECVASGGGSGKIEIKAEINISAELYEVNEDRIISSIAVDESKARQNTAAALTIYYSEQGESVWNIARRYNTTVEAVMNENGLDSETIGSRRMLLIPSV